MWDDVNATVTVGQIQQAIAERTPTLGVNPQKFRRGTVELIGDPAKRLLHHFIGGVGDIVIPIHVAVKTAGSNPVNAVLRIPVTLLIRDDETAVVV